MSVEAFVTQLKQTHKETLKVIKGQDLNTVAHLDSGWTIKDIIIHLALSDWFSRLIIESHTHQTPLITLSDEFKNNNVNDVLREEYKHHSVTRALMNYNDSFQQLIYAYERMDEDTLKRVIRVPWGAEYTVEGFVTMSAEHEAEHRTQIIEALKREVVEG